MPEPTPHELLAERVKKCPGGCVNGQQPTSLCQTCNGTGLNVNGPLFKALWRPNSQPFGGGGVPPYVRRSRDKAMYLLPDALEALWPSYYFQVKHGHIEWFNSWEGKSEAVSIDRREGLGHLFDELCAGISKTMEGAKP